MKIEIEIPTPIYLLLKKIAKEQLDKCSILFQIINTILNICNSNFDIWAEKKRKKTNRATVRRKAPTIKEE